jgi:hypothetical protein
MSIVDNVGSRKLHFLKKETFSLIGLMVHDPLELKLKKNHFLLLLLFLHRQSFMLRDQLQYRCSPKFQLQCFLLKIGGDL